MRIYKYYYKDEPLCMYCKRNNIHLTSILYLINDREMKIDEAVKYYWEHKNKNRLYEVNGKSVKSLLNDFKLYQKFCYKLYRSKDKNVERIYNEIKNEA